MSTVPPRRLLLLVAGFAVWAGGLLTLYGVNALGCAYGWPTGIQRGVLLILLALHLLALAWLVITSRRRHLAQGEKPRPTPFIQYVGLGAALAAWVATLLTLAPSAFLHPCI
jgi:hypothetical protein